MEIKLKDTERIDDIQLKGLRLIQDTTTPSWDLRKSPGISPMWAKIP